MRLYKVAWFLHLKFICQHVLRTNDNVFVVVGSIGTKKQQEAARAAIEDVCDQMPQPITLCIWPASTIWGLQLADYALWAAHRNLVDRPLANYASTVGQHVATRFLPWGQH